MNLSEFSVKRPVSIIMVYVAIFILGIICWLKLPQELYPSINYPRLTVLTQYANAAPEEIESQVTKLIEEAISTVKNLRSMASYSKEGKSIVVAEFTWSANLDFSALYMREKLDQIKERLPRDCEEPIVLKFNPFERPVMVLSLTGSQNISETDLLNAAKNLIKDRIEKIEGVATAAISGGRERQIRVEIDQGKLRARKINILNVSDSIRDDNLNYPAGSTKEQYYEYLVRTMGEYTDVKQINETVVMVKDLEEEDRLEKLKDSNARYDDNTFRQGRREQIYKVSDIAAVYDTLKEKTSYSRYNNNNNISISIQKQANANIIKTCSNVTKALDLIKQQLPPGISLDIFVDQSVFIKNSIKSIISDGVQGGVLAFLILLLFLKNLRLSFIVTLIVPVSILMTIIPMYFMGLSVNMISLMGLALGVGMLLDCAIVVTENISNKRDEGMAADQAAIVGASEMSGPVFSSTLTTDAVFLPIVFVTGIVGQLFRQLALAVVFTQSLSVLVAVTLIPRFSFKAEISRLSTSINSLLEKLFAPFEYIYRKFEDFMIGLLEIGMKRKFSFLAGSFVLFVLSIFALGCLEMKIMPDIDEGQFLITVDMKTGTNVTTTDAAVRIIETALLKEKLVEKVIVTVGSNPDDSSSTIESLGSHQSHLLVVLNKERDISTADYLEKVREDISTLKIEGATINYIQQNQFSAAFGAQSDITVEVKGNDLLVMQGLVQKIEEKLKAIPGIIDVKNSIPEPSPETKVIPNKNKAALYDLSVQKIALTANAAIKGVLASKFKEKGKEYDILVKLRASDVDTFENIKNIPIFTPKKLMIPLNEVCTISRGKSPSQINREDQQRVFKVFAMKKGDVPLSQLNKAVDDTLQKIPVPSGYIIQQRGQTEETKESFKSLIFALILAISLVYMIMASQFESLWQPFVIMFTVPFSVVGAAAALTITSTPLSGPVFLGFILLAGIVVNNGIVLIDAVNAMREEGALLDDALMESSRKRLRPIMMTALTSIIGLVPLALGLGEGSEIQTPMARTVMGGLTLSTFLSIIIIPIILSLGDKILSFTKGTARPKASA